MEARKAVAEKLGFTIEMRNDESVCAFIIPLDEGHYRHVTASDGIEAFNLCASLQERVDVLEKALAKYIDSETLSAAEFEEKYYPFASPINIIADARAALSPKEPGGVK